MEINFHSIGFSESIATKHWLQHTSQSESVLYSEEEDTTFRADSAEAERETCFARK